MEFAPNLRAWGNVPSARHRHSVRRLTPTRSSTSGTRNMASVDTLGDMSAPSAVGTAVTSMRGNPSRRVVGRLAHHVEGSGVEVDQDAVAAEVAVGRHGQRHSDGGGACDAKDGAGPRGGTGRFDRVVMGPQATKPPRTQRNAQERSRTRSSLGRVFRRLRQCHSRPVARLVTVTPKRQRTTTDPAHTPGGSRQQPT